MYFRPQVSQDIEQDFSKDLLHTLVSMKSFYHLAYWTELLADNLPMERERGGGSEETPCLEFEGSLLPKLLLLPFSPSLLTMYSTGMSARESSGGTVILTTFL